MLSMSDPQVMSPNRKPTRRPLQRRCHTFNCLGKFFGGIYWWYLMVYCGVPSAFPCFFFAILVVCLIVCWYEGSRLFLQKQQIYRIRTFIFLIMYRIRPLNNPQEMDTFVPKWHYRNSAKHIRCSSGRKSSGLLRFPQGREMGEQWKRFGASKWKLDECFGSAAILHIFALYYSYYMSFYPEFFLVLKSDVCVIFLHLSSHLGP